MLCTFEVLIISFSISKGVTTLKVNEPGDPNLEDTHGIV